MTPPRGRRWARSLHLRLLAATLAALLAALVLAGVLLAGLFRDHVTQQFGLSLTAWLDQVTARFDVDAAGQPRIDALALTDPRWSRPYSGLYWQVDGGAGQRGVLRSRSLWDATLSLPDDALADGVAHVHEVAGPDGAPLLVVERSVVRGMTRGEAAAPWRLVVAADRRETEAAVARFNGVLRASLAVLFGLLCLAAVAQVAVGLAPLRALQRALAAMRGGHAQRLDGRFPAEVQPLIDDFNHVLDRHAEVVARARTQAGNLAHAIKTPLAALAQAAAAARRQPQALATLLPVVEEQVGVARRQVDWHLARARAAATQGLPGARTALPPVVAGLLRVMARVHGTRGLRLVCAPIDPGLAFAGELQDLQEMLGNLLDNACKWARHEVRIGASALDAGPAPRLCIVIDDDGPGIDASRRDAVRARGARLDESVPGSGLGLAIVQELAGLYGGGVALGAAASGGLSARLELPRG